MAVLGAAPEQDDHARTGAADYSAGFRFTKDSGLVVRMQKTGSESKACTYTNWGAGFYHCDVEAARRSHLAYSIAFQFLGDLRNRISHMVADLVKRC